MSKGVTWSGSEMSRSEMPGFKMSRYGCETSRSKTSGCKTVQKHRVRNVRVRLSMVRNVRVQNVRVLYVLQSYWFRYDFGTSYSISMLVTLHRVSLWFWHFLEPLYDYDTFRGLFPDLSMIVTPPVGLYDYSTFWGFFIIVAELYHSEISYMQCLKRCMEIWDC